MASSLRYRITNHIKLVPIKSNKIKLKNSKININQYLCIFFFIIFSKPIIILLKFYTINKTKQEGKTRIELFIIYFASLNKIKQNIK